MLRRGSAKKPKASKPPKAAKAPKPAGPKPKPDVYTTMLGVAAGFLALGCVMLLLEWWSYQ